MMMKRYAALSVPGALGVFLLAGAAQQRSSGPVGPSAGQQAAILQAQQQLQLSAQNGSSTPGLQPASRPGSGSPPFSPDQGTDTPPYLQDQNKLKRNDERQRRLETDTGRLLALANLLKSEIAASGSESMNPEMVRQMDEIEKLARSVKERMRN